MEKKIVINNPRKWIDDLFNEKEKIRVDFEQFQILCQLGFIQYEKTDKISLLTETEANAIGFDKTIDKCMEYTMEHNREVIFKYVAETQQIFDDVFIGDDWGCNSFITEEQIAKYPLQGTFHTHPKANMRCFNMDDLKEFRYEYNYEAMVGIPLADDIITLKREDFWHDKKLTDELNAFVENNTQKLIEGYRTYFWVSRKGTSYRGDFTMTAKGKKFEQCTTYLFRKILKPVLKIKKWKNLA